MVAMHGWTLISTSRSLAAMQRELILALHGKTSPWISAIAPNPLQVQS
jgi:hypothetical protein